MAKMTIYDRTNTTEDYDGECPDLREDRRGPLGIEGDWNDQVRKIVVHEGVWRLYEHVNFDGRSFDYGPGEHVDAFLREVSSFKPIG